MAKLLPSTEHIAHLLYHPRLAPEDSDGWDGELVALLEVFSIMFQIDGGCGAVVLARLNRNWSAICLCGTFHRSMTSRITHGVDRLMPEEQALVFLDIDLVPKFLFWPLFRGLHLPVSLRIAKYDLLLSDSQ